MRIFLYFLYFLLQPKPQGVKIYTTKFFSWDPFLLIFRSHEASAFFMCCGRTCPENFLLYKQMWSQRHNTSTFLLLASGFVHWVNQNSSLDWTWEKCILLAHKELNQDQEQWGHPQDGGWVEASLEHAELRCQCVCCSFRSAFFLLFSRKYFSLLFFIFPFSCGECQRKKGNVVLCSEISSFLPATTVTGNGGVMAILGLHTPKGQVI